MEKIILLASLVNPASETNNLPAWVVAALAAFAAAALSKKQIRKLKWKLAWQYAKSKLPFSKKGKGKNTGLLILSIILVLGCFGVAIWLGMLKEFLIAIGALLLLLLLFMGADKRTS
jgi:hypothetical protein